MTDALALRFSTRSLLAFTCSAILHAGALALVLLAWKSAPVRISTGASAASALEFVSIASEQKLLPSPKRVAAAPVEGEIAVRKKSQTKPSRNVIENATAPSAGRGESKLQESGGQEHLLSGYLTGFRAAVESRKVYPALSRRTREAGLVIVAVRLARDGAIEEARIKKGSGFERLDQAALASVSTVGRYEPLPTAHGAESLTVDVPIEFSL